MKNKKRLIDALDLVIKLAKNVGVMVRNGKPQSEIYSKVLECIADSPTVDAVEVVRCKDCINNFVRYGEKECYCGHPDGLNDILRPDDFCSYGERREGE